ncbi:hypothetical protein [Isoptericola sp. NPDC057191]|uniref:hypothetical protein n=1 Tax=Isoptericola sp. NPDC057191 TaxID=3346041 RepID=UPI00362ADF31
MGTSIRARAHAAATQEDIHDLVRTLNQNVGPTIVQTIAGVKDRTLPSKWAKPDGPTPRPDAQRRLRLGFQVWWTINSAQGRNVALAWLVGANPLLGENLPLQYIVDEKAADVLGAAVAFVEDVHAA